MKKIVKRLFLLSILLISSNLIAQTKYIHLGAGMLKSSNFYSGYNSRSLPIYIGGETDLSFLNIASLDFIRTGAYFNFVTHTYGGSDVGSLGFGIRVSTSPIDLYSTFSGTEIDTKGFDIYAGVNLGYELVDASFFLGSRTRFTPFVGTRYLFGKRIGAYAELGRTSYGLATIGVAFGLG